MQPTSLKQVITWGSEHYGLPVSTGRPTLVRKINAVRQALWKNEAIRDVCYIAEGCECAEAAESRCNAGAGTDFVGITLPQGVATARSLHINEIPIPITDGRIDVGMTSGGRSRGRLEAFIHAVATPISKRIPKDYVGNIIIKAVEAKDNNCRVGVQYVTPSGRVMREDVLATTAGPETSAPVAEFTSIVLPERIGFIKFLTVDGYELGNYHPSILAPRHTVVQLNGVRPGSVIHWTGYREPAAVVFDTDLVEIGNYVDWVNAFNWLDAFTKSDKTKGDLAQLQITSAFSQGAAEQELRSARRRKLKGLAPKGIQNLSKHIRSFH